MPYSVIQTLYTQTRKYLTLEKVRVLENPFVNSQFVYAYLIGMLCEKILYFNVWKTHHKTQNSISVRWILRKFAQLDNSVLLHQRHLRFLVTEVFKSLSKASPELMRSYYSFKYLSYNLRRGLLCHWHLQSLQGMEPILYILKVRSFEITYLIGSNPVPWYLNTEEVWRILEVLFSKISYIRIVLLLSLTFLLVTASTVDQ